MICFATVYCTWYFTIQDKRNKLALKQLKTEYLQFIEINGMRIELLLGEIWYFK
jgi:hypothetical protein